VNIHKCLLLSVVFGAASALSADTLLLDDSFTSGTTGYIGRSGAGNQGTPGIQNPPSSAVWFGNNSTFAPPASPGISPIQYIQGSGITIPNAGNTGQSVTAFFESPGSYQTLGVGDKLTMSINFTLGSTSITPTGIRFQLFNSASTGTFNNQLTVNTGNSRTLPNAQNTNTLLYSGYFVGFAAGTPGSGGIDTIYNRQSGDTANLIVSAPASGALGTAIGPSPGLGTTDTYQAKLTLLYTGSAMNAGFSLFDVTTPATDLSAYTLNVTDTGTSPRALVTSFDGLTIGEISNENTPMTISNVTVSTTTIPEPSAYAAILGLAALGFAGIRSRRQRQLEQLK
jgi:hypothetical protein